MSVQIGTVRVHGSTPEQRLTDYLRQWHGALSRSKAGEVSELTVQIAGLRRRIRELETARDRLCQQVWECDYKDLE